MIEEARLLAVGGRLLVVDHHRGLDLVDRLKHFILKLIGFSAELAAGGDHFRNYREFMAGNGLDGPNDGPSPSGRPAGAGLAGNYCRFLAGFRTVKGAKIGQ